MYPRYDVIKMEFTSVVLLPKTHNPSLIMRKIPKGCSTKYLITIPQNCQSHHKQEKYEKLIVKRS